MTEILYLFESLGTSVFLVAAVLCLVVGAIGFRFDKPCVVVVSLILGFGCGYFLSMAAWGEGIGTMYIGSCIGLLSLLVSIKVRPIKRFFLGGVSIFLAVAAVVIVIVNSVAGTTVTYDFYTLEGGQYQQVAISARQSDVRRDMAAIVGAETNDISASLSENRQQVTFQIPAANYGQLTSYGEQLTARYEELNSVEITDYSSGWTIAIIIAAVFGLAGGILAQFKPKFMQILGTSVFGGVFGSVFAYLGLGELSPLLIAPILAVAGWFLQHRLTIKKESDLPESDLPVEQEAPTV